jgi:hypothetical protein
MNMSYSWFDQTADMDGIPSRIVMKENYGIDRGSVSPKSLIFPVMDSAVSPPLSEIELADILAAEQEFSSGQGTIYESAQDLINALHASRERYKREAGREQ